MLSVYISLSDGVINELIPTYNYKTFVKKIYNKTKLNYGRRGPIIDIFPLSGFDWEVCVQ